MSGSETGVMTNNTRVEPFNGGHRRSPATPSEPLIQNLRLAYSTQTSAVYKPVSITPNPATNNNSRPFQPPSAAAAGAGGAATGGSASGGEAAKKKRGRPRKYGPDGSIALALVQPAQPVPVAQPPPQPQQPPSGGGGNGGSGDGGFLSPTSPPASAVPVVAASAPAAVPGGATVDPPPSGGPTPASAKKGRGRPPGSTNKKHHAVPMGGSVPDRPELRAHILTVKAGEDVASRIMTFAQQIPRAICVLSATGSISNVTIRQLSTSGGTVTYEGRFELLSLTGYFMPQENGTRTGGLQVTLADSEGHILGGGLAGVLIAAAPIQLVLGSFIAKIEKQPKPSENNSMEPAAAIGRLMLAGGTTGPSSPASRGTFSESSGGPGSPIHQNSGAFNNTGVSNMSWK